MKVSTIDDDDDDDDVDERMFVCRRRTFHRKFYSSNAFNADLEKASHSQRSISSIKGDHLLTKTHPKH